MIRSKFLSVVLLLLLVLPVSALDVQESPTEVFLIDEDTLFSALESQAEVFADVFSDYVAAMDVPPALDSSALSFTADSALGNLEFFLPAGSPSSPFITSGSGVLLNGTSATLYLYSPRYPGYTFQASRFSGFQYRTNSSTQNPWYDLNLRNPVGLGGAPSGSGLLDFLPIVCLLILSFTAVGWWATHKLQV